jgi:hypothetical protein
VAPGATPAATSGRPGAGSDQYAAKPVLIRARKGSATYAIQAGTTATERQFASMVGSLDGVRTDVAYFRAVTGSSPAADVAVLTFSPAQARSTSFQNQIVSQLVISASGSTKVTFDTVDGRTFTVAGTKRTVVGTFDGDSAIVVMALPGAKSLEHASGATFAYLNRK